MRAAVQVLAVLTHFVDGAEEARRALGQLLPLLAAVHPPSVKQYMECSAVCLGMRFPELLEVGALAPSAAAGRLHPLSTPRRHWSSNAPTRTRGRAD